MVAFLLVVSGICFCIASFLAGRAYEVIRAERRRPLEQHEVLREMWERGRR